MATITEDYVSFEIAKLLKEKGFDIQTLSFYREFDRSFDFPDDTFLFDWNDSKGYLSAPTLQMACKWLREVHNIFIEPKMSKNTFLWGYRVSISNGSTTCLHANIFNKCEEACEAAIKYCLENLI